MIDLFGYNNKLCKTNNTEQYKQMVVCAYGLTNLEYDLLKLEFEIPNELIKKSKTNKIGVWQEGNYALVNIRVFKRKGNISFIQKINVIFNTNTVIIISEEKIETLYRLVKKPIAFEKFTYVFFISFINSHLIFLNKINILVNNNNNDINELIFIYKGLLELKKTILMEKIIFSDLVDTRGLFIESIKPFLNNLADNFLNISEVIDIEIENINILKDKYRFEQSNNLDKIMKRLTSLTLLFSLPMLIAGIYGMNFTFGMGTGLVYGFYYVLGFIGIVFLTMLYYFRKNKWI